jgi:hypothetical protein
MYKQLLLRSLKGRGHSGYLGIDDRIIQLKETGLEHVKKMQV